MDSRNVLDGTKIKTYKTCPRKYLFEHEFGWRSEEPAHNLLFGIAFHKGLEVLYADWKKTGVPGYTNERIELAYETFLEDYRQHYPEDTDDIFEPKVPWNVLLMYKLYQEQYQDQDHFEVIATEAAGGLPIGENGEQIFFRLDTVCRDERGVFILEHKTSGWRVDLWAASFKENMQVGTGLYALNSVFDPEEVYGVIIQGFFFRRLPRLKKNGEPYANSGPGNEIVRLPQLRSNKRLQDWLTTTKSWFNRIQEDRAVIESCDPEEQVLAAFPKNEMGCLTYGKECPFMDFCQAWPNPIPEAAYPPIGFKKEFWNPMDEPPAEGAIVIGDDGKGDS